VRAVLDAGVDDVRTVLGVRPDRGADDARPLGDGVEALAVERVADQDVERLAVRIDRREVVAQCP